MDGAAKAARVKREYGQPNVAYQSRAYESWRWTLTMVIGLQIASTGVT